MMRNVIITMMAIMIAVASVGADAFSVSQNVRTTLINQDQDSVKPISLKKVNDLLDAELVKPNIEYRSADSGITNCYNFFLQFININASDEDVKTSYDFKDYSVSWAMKPLRVEIAIHKEKVKHVIRFDD